MNKKLIRYSALGIAFVLIVGAFGMWALTSQETVNVSTGTIDPSVSVSTGTNVETDDPILLDSVSGEYGDVASDYHLYTIDKSSQQEYTGGYEVTLHLSNAAEVSQDLKTLVMDVTLKGKMGGDLEERSQDLTLENGKVSFIIENNFFDSNGVADVYIEGDSYRTYDDVNEVPNLHLMIDVEEIGRAPNE
ncbi:MAG: hypothetical protein ACOC85_03965 [Thermoplasmatota archaeon]